jgi:hypothetical protein
VNAYGTHPPTARPIRATARPATGPAPVAEGSDRRDLARLAIRVSALAVGASIVVAAVVGATTLAEARRWLGFSFRAIPARPDIAIGIFANNVRSILGVFGLLAFARLAGRSRDVRTRRWTVRLGELILLGAVTANVVTVGAGLGAYGERMVRALLPHGPVELAAYSLALALYLQDRHRPVRVYYILRVAAVSVALLAVAAALETFVSL